MLYNPNLSPPQVFTITGRNVTGRTTAASSQKSASWCSGAVDTGTR